MPKPSNISRLTFRVLRHIISRLTSYVSRRTYHDGRLGKAITRVVGKPGSLRFRLARDPVGVMGVRALSMGLSFAVSVVLARLLGCGGYD